MQDYEPSEFQDQLLRGLTHKMNNILSLFHGYLGMLLDDRKIDANTASGLKFIQDGAFKASELMDRTQCMIRPSSVVLREMNLGEFLRTSKCGLDLLASRGIRLEINCQEDLPMVLADVARMRAALSEIVSNAVEASPDNSIIRITAGMDADVPISGNSIRPITWVVLSIHNRGNEMPPEVLKRIFEPFFTTRQKRSAFGLGLPIALGNVRQFKGSIRFERVGEETICRIRIPSRSEKLS